MDFSVSVVWTGGFTVFLYAAADAAISLSAPPELAGCHMHYVFATQSFYTLMIAIEAIPIDYVSFSSVACRESRDRVSELNRESADGNGIFKAYF